MGGKKKALHTLGVSTFAFAHLPHPRKEFELSSFIKAQDSESAESREHIVIFICENCSVHRFPIPPSYPSLSGANVMARVLPLIPGRMRDLALFLLFRGFCGRIFGSVCCFVLLWVATPYCSGFPLNAGTAPQITQQEADLNTLQKRNS